MTNKEFVQSIYPNSMALRSYFYENDYIVVTRDPPQEIIFVLYSCKTETEAWERTKEEILSNTIAIFEK